MPEATADMKLGKDGDRVVVAGSVVATPAATTIGGTTLYYKAAGTFASQGGAAQGFTVGTDNTITYTDRQTRDVVVRVVGTVTVATGDDAIKVAVYVGGAKAFEITGTTSSSALAVDFIGAAEIDAGEKIEIYLKNDDATANLTLSAGFKVQVFAF